MAVALCADGEPSFALLLARPEMRERLEQLGATVRASTPDEFANTIAAEMKLWGQVVRDNKIGAAE